MIGACTGPIATVAGTATTTFRLAASTRFSGRSNPTQRASSGASNRLSRGGTRSQGARSAMGLMGANRRSQRAQTRPGPPRRLRNVTAGERLVVRLPQTRPDTGFVPVGQGVAGSNPAVPTQIRLVLRPRNRPPDVDGSACALPSVAPTKRSGLPCRPSTLTSDYRQSARPRADSRPPRRIR